LVTIFFNIKTIYLFFTINDMQISRLKAVRLHYEAKAAEAEETIKVYLTNAVGIGEHPQVMEELRGQIEILTNAKDVILVIDELIEKFTDFSNGKGVN
jgi:hypothetical protein